MKKIISLLTVFLLAAAVFGNGVSLNSPGTRAISMGGAYISHVDDYSAPYWNPAGLQNTEGFQASFFITDIIPLATYKYELAGIDAESKTLHNIAPNASFLWTCMLHDKLRMGLSFIVPAGIGVEWEGDDLTALTGGESMEWKSSIVVFNISLSAAYKFGDKLNLGGAFHLVHGSMTMDRGTVIPMVGAAQYSEESDGWGWGLGLGAQYMLNEKITLGASMRTRMTVPFSGDAEITSDLAGTLADYEFDRDVTWPLWVGGGVAFRPTEKLLLAAEAQWSQWSETEEYLIAKHDSEEDTLHLLWDDAVQIRFGAEYWLNEKFALRGGFYLDPSPGPDETQTILIPVTDFNVITFGAGYKLDKLSFDVAFEYLMGKERDVEATADNMPGKHGLDIMVPSFAVTYKF